MRTISGPVGSKVSLGLVRSDRHQEQHLPMHLRELMLVHKVVEVATLTRQPKRLPTTSPSGTEVVVSDLRTSWTPAHVLPSATSSAVAVAQPSTRPEPAEAPRSEMRRPSTRELLRQAEACAPPRPADPADARHEPGRPARAPSSAGSAALNAACVSACVGEVAPGGRFLPLVIT